MSKETKEKAAAAAAAKEETTETTSTEETTEGTAVEAMDQESQALIQKLRDLQDSIASDDPNIRAAALKKAKRVGGAKPKGTPLKDKVYKWLLESDFRYERFSRAEVRDGMALSTHQKAYGAIKELIADGRVVNSSHTFDPETGEPTNTGLFKVA